MTIKLFGLMKTLADNESELTVPLDGIRKAKDIVALVNTMYPRIGELLQAKRVLISVNQDIAQEDTEIREGDEVALLPPFAGGSQETDIVSDEALLVRVQRENFSLDTEIDRVRARSKRIGGIATFLGTARDWSKGHAVSGITFEHYEGMAQKTLRNIRARALQQFEVLEVLILHRYGAIEIGENIVLIVVGAEHRADAFKACKWCIDELKQITPIWKLEQTPQGRVWVEEHP